MTLHTGVEVWLLDHPFRSRTRGLALFALLATTLLQCWVIGTMAPSGTCGIVNSIPLGVVTDGPFRWVRHPSYTAVTLEILAILLVYGAWITVLVGGAVHVVTLAQRVRLEEQTLFAEAAYREAMQDKPRFLPRLWLRRG